MTPDRFRTRSLQHEILDDHEPEQAVVDRIFRFLSMVNRRFGGARATIERFEAFSGSWRPGDRIRVLDVATGAADLPRHLARWARGKGVTLDVTALDLSPSALDFARRTASPAEPVRLVRADVAHPPFADQTFDYVTCALFFHHLTDDQIVSALQTFDRLAVRGIVVNDLARSRQAYVLTWLLTWPFHPILNHDGPLSVRRALTPAELARLADRAGLPWLSVRRHFGHRMTLAGDREGTAPGP